MGRVPEANDGHGRGPVSPVRLRSLPMKRSLLSTLGVAIALSSAGNASAFFGLGGCGCAEPSCGYAEPSCGCAMACEPSCGCEASCGCADPCCAPKHRCCIFKKLFSRKHCCE